LLDLISLPLNALHFVRSQIETLASAVALVQAPPFRDLCTSQGVNVFDLEYLAEHGFDKRSFVFGGTHIVGNLNNTHKVAHSNESAVLVFDCCLLFHGL